MRICLICPAFRILAEDEIAAAVWRLAGILARHGAAVTVLLAGDDAAPPAELPAGVAAAVLPPYAIPFAPCAAATSLSYRCRDWLAERDFQLVLCPERGGLAYYPLLARRQRLALAGTAIAVLAWGPSLWLAEADGRLVDEFALLVVDYQERRAVALADALVAPHHGLLDWMRQAGWALPADVAVLPLPAESAADPASADGTITELVYVGGLERRDGLLLFCAAVERIAGRLAERGVAVRLLGPLPPHPDLDMPAHLAERMARWPFAHAVEIRPLTPEILAERLAPGRLAVLPALALGEPAALGTCRALGRPLLAAAVPGAAELVDEAVLVPPTPPQWAERLAAALDAPPSPLPPPAETAAAWHSLAQRLGAAALPPPQPLPPLLVSVCVSHFNRPHLLERAVASLRAQSWPHLEVIVVDDGSPDAAAQARLDALEREWGAAVTVIRQPNRYLGAARNRAAAAARGEFLLFMDDDNRAMPDEIETMVRAAVETGADVLTTVIKMFADDQAPERDEASALWVPLGGCAAGGLYSNVFGDANALIRRSAFQAVGGFSEDFGLGLEDWELFARLALSGVRFDVVAKPLLWYRQDPGGMLLGSINRPAELGRAARGYLAAAPGLAPALLFAQGVHFRQDFYRREYLAACAMAEARLQAMREVEGLVAERDATIRNMTRLIEQRDEAIASQGRMLEERWAAMQEMSRIIHERDDAITRIKNRRGYRLLHKAGLVE